MELVLAVQFMALLMAIFIYNAMKPKDRANLWRKIQCYSAARAEGIETYNLRYRQYKTEMGVN